MGQQHKCEPTIDLVKNRLFQGGRISALWKMFIAGGLTGDFILSGQEWSTTIELDKGKVLDLTYKKKHKKSSGMNGFQELRHSLVTDEATRFSILVPEKQQDA